MGHDQDLVARIVRVRDDRQAGLQDVVRIVRRHDDRDQRRVGGGAADGAVGERQGDRLPRPAAAVECGLQGGHVAVPRLRLAARRRRAGAHAPAVKALAHMDYRGVPLRHAQRQVVVLREVERAAEAAEIAHQGGAVHRQVPCVHHGGQQQRAPIRLAEQVQGAVIEVDLALVRVHKINRRVGAQPGRDLGEGVVRQHVVVVQQGDVVPGRHRQRLVAGRRDAAVPGRVADLDPRVQRREAVQQGLQAGLARAVIDQAQLPVRVGLAQHGQDRPLEQRQRRAVHRHQHRDQRTRRRGAGMGRVQPEPLGGADLFGPVAAQDRGRELLGVGRRTAGRQQADGAQQRADAGCRARGRGGGDHRGEFGRQRRGGLHRLQLRQLVVGRLLRIVVQRRQQRHARCGGDARRQDGHRRGRRLDARLRGRRVQPGEAPPAHGVEIQR